MIDCKTQLISVVALPRIGRTCTGIVNEDLQSGVPGQHLLCQTPYLRQCGKVGGEPLDTRIPGRLAQIGDHTVDLCLVSPVNEHMRSLPGKMQSGQSADAVGGTRNEDRLLCDGLHSKYSFPAPHLGQTIHLCIAMFVRIRPPCRIDAFSGSYIGALLSAISSTQHNRPVVTPSVFDPIMTLPGIACASFYIDFWGVIICFMAKLKLSSPAPVSVRHL